MFSHSNTPIINGGTFQVQNYGAGGFRDLQQAVASNAFHDSGDIVDQPKCHPKTRTAVINKIMDWILRFGVDDQNAVILWMYGPAGAGKTAIAHDIAHRCNIENLLLASFFFSRFDPTRSNAKSLIPTIAYQIAINIPGTREKISATIEQDPFILTRSLEAQMAALIVEPLREPLEAGYFNAPTSRCLIIIDGLDECDTSTVQCGILQIMSLLFHDYHLPLLILVSSRPERHLSHSFRTGSLPEFHTTLALDDTYEPDNDIRLFLTDNFRQVKATHPMSGYLDHSWPSVDVLEGLVKKSSGQFIYASTVVKYVSSIRHKPADRLDVILGIRPPRHAREMPFGELDALYTHIFTAVEDIETVLLILGFHLLLNLFAYPSMDIGNLEHFFLLSKGDIMMLLGDLSSLVPISNVETYIHFSHASLGDFLLDPARSKEFYIDLSNIHTRCMHLCFHHNKQYSISKDYNAHIIYAGINLLWHCENTPPSSALQLREEIINFSLHIPDFSSVNTPPRRSLFYFVPQFLQFIKTLPFDDVDEIYNQKLAVVLDFFTFKLKPYYSTFSESIDPTINRGTFQVHNYETTIGGFENLQKAVASSAFHNSGDIGYLPKCYPNTRTAVIKKIMDWILGLGVDDQNAIIMWMYGSAGVGKTSIAHAIAHRCDLEKLLLASFFFSHSDNTRRGSPSLIATIAYQISINIPGTGERIFAAIERDPLIFNRSLEAQVTALIAEPLCEPLEAGYFNTPTSRRLIIIDGLDECDPHAVQCRIIRVISLLFHSHHLPLLILFSSRPDRHLTHFFRTGSLPELHTMLDLNDDTYLPDSDIQLIPTDNFRQVKATHPMSGSMTYSSLS